MSVVISGYSVISINSAFQNIIFQIDQTVQQGVGAPRIVVSTPFLNLHSKEQKFSIKLLKNLLQSIKPKTGDALYDPSSPIFSVGVNLDKPQYDSQDPNYWVKMITRFTIDEDQKILTNTEKKMFYNGLLLLIQNDLYKKVGENWVINPESAFIQHEFLLSESFTDNTDFLKDETDAIPDNWKDDFDLVSKLDIVLQDMLGLVGSASLVSGFMTFSETSVGGIRVDFVPHTIPEQSVLNSQFDLRALNYHGYHKTLGKMNLRSYGSLSKFLGSLFINGFYHVLEGRQDTQSGSVDITMNQEIRPSTEAFLDDYFEVYDPRDDWDYEDAVNLILGGYKSKISDQNQKNKANLIGRDELYVFLSKKVEDILDTIFLPLPYAGYTRFDQFLEDPEVWKSRTLVKAQNFLRSFIDHPTEARDFIGTLREILRTGNDGYITLQAPASGGGGLQTHGNALLDQGLRIPISYDELVEFLSFDNLEDLSIDALFTLLFTYRTKGFSLDFNQFWGINKEEIRDKAEKSFNTIIGAFTKENLGEYYYEKEFTIKFYIDGGAGIQDYYYISNAFKKFGISEYRIKFTPSDLKSLKNAIASMITYLYAFPNTFAAIKQGSRQGRNFLFADIFNIRTPEYVSESDYSATISGDFMWSEDGSVNGLTRENYDNLIAAYSDNFNDRDIRYLLGFDNEDIVGRILSKFQTIFREQIDNSILITDLRIGGSNSMFGDFPFQLSNYYDSSLIEELISQGLIENEIGLTAVTRNLGIPTGQKIPPEASRTIWLEQARFTHILDEHKEEFKDDFQLGDDATTIGNFIFYAIKNYPIHNTFPGAGGQSKFYVYSIHRTGNYLKVLVHDDGSIITAFPSWYDN
jgi:hypothetical protein